MQVESIEFSVISIDGEELSANEKSKLISEAKKEMVKQGDDILVAVSEQLQTSGYSDVLPSGKNLAYLARPYSCVICPDEGNWFGSIYFSVEGLDEGVGVRVDFGITFNLLNADMHFSG